MLLQEHRRALWKLELQSGAIESACSAGMQPAWWVRDRGCDQAGQNVSGAKISLLWARTPVSFAIRCLARRAAAGCVYEDDSHVVRGVEWGNPGAADARACITQAFVDKPDRIFASGPQI
jgi:hypothetical protein